MAGGARQVSLIRYLCELLARRRRLLQRLRATRDALRREREETVYLRKALNGAVDSIDALTWAHRRSGAEDKYVVEHLREKRT